MIYESLFCFVKKNIHRCMVKRLILFMVVVFFSSCASTPPKSSLASISSLQPLSPLSVTPFRHDIFHTVSPGETLWRISKMYDVEIGTITKANNLKSDSKIVMGQRLLIPHAAPLRPIIPLYKTNKWRFIIIHHSATDVGNAY